MEIIVRLFPSGKIIAGLRQVCDQSHLFMDSAAARARRNAADTLPRSPAMIGPGAGCRGYLAGDPCSLFQTQAAQAVLQSREGPAMTRMAVLLGLMGIGMSGYSSRQLTLHCKPSSHLFRWRTGWKNSVHMYKCRLTLDQVSRRNLKRLNYRVFSPAGSVFLHLFSLCINPRYSIKLCHSCDFVIFEVKRLLPYGSGLHGKRGISPFNNTPSPLHIFYCKKLFA